MELTIVILVVVAIAAWALSRRNRPRTDEELGERITDAGQWVARLSGQRGALSPTTEAARCALAEAGRCHDVAAARLDGATTVVAARLARDSAVEGMYYVRAARSAMDLDPGPPLPALDGQARAGAVDTGRTVEFAGRTLAASPAPGPDTAHHHPGGLVAGRPVPAGWYSETWWADARTDGQWDESATALFAALLAGMDGVGYSAEDFETGRGRDDR